MPFTIVGRLLAPLSGLGRLRSWRDADKCVLVGLVGLPAALWIYAVLATVRADPAAMPYFAPDFTVRVMLPVHTFGVTGGLLAILGMALLQRRYGAVRSPLMVNVTVQFVVVASAVESYVYGHYTTLFTPTALAGFGPAGLLLFDRRAAVWGVVTFLTVTVATTIAEQAGWIPYAPLLRTDPFADGRLAPSWLWGNGGAFAVLTLGCVGLLSYGISLARRDEAGLRRTTSELTATNVDIRGTNERLARAAEDLKAAQAQLVHTEKMASLGRLVAEVAHELNNPASFVHGGLATLRQTLDGILEAMEAYDRAAASDPVLAAASREMGAQVDLGYLRRETPALVRVCMEGSDRIRRIVGDLRLFSRADEGAREAVDVVAAVETAVDLLAERILSGAIVLHRSYPEGERATVQASRAQMDQVWTSLLANAIDAVSATPEPEIRIAIRRGTDGGGGGAVEVEVADNGAGIPSEAIGRVFEPFFTTKPVGHGTGLGLSIAYGAVQSHGGQIAVASEVGRGTRITVRLPVGGGRVAGEEPSS